jgi:transcriptional regulator with XRE-family HTH domain
VIRLKFERTTRRISQERLSRASRVAQPIISHIEKGTWTPSASQLDALGRALHVSPPELLLQQVVMPDDTRPRYVEACVEGRREAER